MGAWSDFLAHHGIKGQKWGVQNGPPYPLDEKVSFRMRSDAVMKTYEKQRKALEATEVGKQIIEKYKFENMGSALLADHDQDWEEVWENFTAGGKPLSDYFDQSLTSIPYWTNNSTGSKYASPTAMMREFEARDREAGYDFMAWSDDDASELADKVERGRVNPDFGDPGTTNNCTKCTFATELMRRGQGTMAAGRQTYPASAYAMEYWFNDAHTQTFSGAQAIETAQSTIDSFGDRSSGALGIYRPDGRSGHSVHWTNLGNSFQIEDGQIGRVYTGSDFESALSSFLEHQSAFGTEQIRVTRLDNCTVNWDHAIEDGCLRGNRVLNSRTGRIVDTW